MEHARVPGGCSERVVGKLGIACGQTLCDPLRADDRRRVPLKSASARERRPHRSPMTSVPNPTTNPLAPTPQPLYAGKQESSVPTGTELFLLRPAQAGGPDSFEISGNS